ncbi:hypothetical protein AB0F07_35950 [Streptomyces fructofermentans]|uniref:hypothetical protein n=1 Tax=Streptomyces fructofermentans TaxID=152141 RepID=UPI0033FEE9A3
MVLWTFLDTYSEIREEGDTVNISDYATAWGHPPTRRAWGVHLAISATCLIAWIVVAAGSLAAVVVFASPVFSLTCVPFVIYSTYRVFVQASLLPAAMRMKRILREYPWNVAEGAPRGLSSHPDVLGRQCGWFEFPNPARPEERLPVVFPSHVQVGWWHRRMAPRAGRELGAQIDTVWFAGDPRFLCLLAAPTADGSTPRRLHVLHQQMDSEQGHRSLESWGVTAEDIERGRRVGVHPVRS